MVVLLLPSLEEVQPSSEGVQGREEVGPCSQNQLDTFLQQLLDRGIPCSPGPVEGPGRTRSAEEEVGMDSREMLEEEDRSRSSFQETDIQKRERRSEPEQHEKHLLPV